MQSLLLILQLFYQLKPKLLPTLHPNICSWGEQMMPGFWNFIFDGDPGGTMPWGKDFLSKWTQCSMGSLWDPHS